MAASQPIKSLRKIKTIAKLLRDSPRNYTLFIVGLNTALRGSDLLTLTADQVSRLRAEDAITVIEKKTGKKRDVYFNKKAAEAISSEPSDNLAFQCVTTVENTSNGVCLSNEECFLSLL